jgi:hypothetical protein
MSNVGKWDNWYHGLQVDEPQAFGDQTSYRMAGEWLEPCDTVGDWGCGKGAFRHYVPSPRLYYGFDGSNTPFAHEIVDLTTFRCATEGVLLRHVLEHNYGWRDILRNAAASFTKRMVVVIFTPMIMSAEPRVEEIDFQTLGPLGGVPDLSFSLAALTEVAPDHLVSATTVESITQYHTETVLFYER